MRLHTNIQIFLQTSYFFTDPQFRSISQKLYRLNNKRNKNNFLNQPLRVRTTTVLYQGCCRFAQSDRHCRLMCGSNTDNKGHCERYRGWGRTCEYARCRRSFRPSRQFMARLFIVETSTVLPAMYLIRYLKSTQALYTLPKYDHKSM